MPPKTRSNADARARALAKREALRRQERNRRLGFIGLWSTVGLVVVLVVVLVIALNVGHKNDTKALNQPASAALVADLSSIPESAYAQAGTTGLGKTIGGLTAMTDTPITTDGKPTFVYVGGEFCPLCAGQRWVLAATLARFGTLSGLETTRSAADDGNYATLSFRTATYTSQYLSLDAKEILDRARKKLQTLDAAAQASYDKYGGGGVPYISVNNAYRTTYQYNPEVLGTMTADQIAAAIKDPTTTIGQQVLAASNVLSAAICSQTKQQPAAVCGTAEVKAGAAGLTTGGSGSGSSTG